MSTPRTACRPSHTHEQLLAVVTLLLICGGAVATAPDVVVSQVQLRLRNGDVSLKVADYRGSKLIAHVTRELNADLYKLRQWESWLLQKGGSPLIIVDIGANVGLFSMAAALSYPEAHVYALEPLAYNYRNLLTNVAVNNISNVRCFNLGTSDDRGSPRSLTVFLAKNSGGASAFSTRTSARQHVGLLRQRLARMTSLDAFMAEQQLPHISLLKIDCEGCEYETLLTSRQLSRVRALVAEWHLNDLLRSQGYSFEGLQRYVRSQNPKMRLFHFDISMRA